MSTYCSAIVFYVTRYVGPASPALQPIALGYSPKQIDPRFLQMPGLSTKADAAPAVVNDDEPDDWWGSPARETAMRLAADVAGQGQEDLQHRVFRYVFWQMIANRDNDRSQSKAQR